MNDQERIKKIDIENLVFIVYYLIISLSIYDNYLEKKYIKDKSESNKKKYRQLLILIFSITLIIYLYFAYDSYQSIQSNKANRFDYLSFIASLLVVISGVIFLYIAIADQNIESEISFN